MRPFGTPALLVAAVVLLAADTPGQAAWNNVYQVSFFRNRRNTSNYPCCPQPVVAQASPAACCPQPACPPTCTTQYVQRSYYQPVQSYQQKTYYEPVTTYQTSYYYEPVTSYRYSCYYDPCTCSYQQIAQPTTSYRLRSKCNPVTSYLQRTQCVPVTSYQLSYYYEPVTTCCNTTTGAPIPAVPGVGEFQQPQQPRPRVGEDNGAGQTDSYYRRQRETNPPPMNGAEGSSFRQPTLPPVQKDPPKVKLDRIAYLPDHNVEGRVTRVDDQSPRAGAKVLFVSAERDGKQQTMTSDEPGRFRATLDQGAWLVYVRNSEGTPVFQKRIEVKSDNTPLVTLTSR